MLVNDSDMKMKMYFFCINLIGPNGEAKSKRLYIASTVLHIKVNGWDNKYGEFIGDSQQWVVTMLCPMISDLNEIHVCTGYR